MCLCVSGGGSGKVGRMIRLSQRRESSGGQGTKGPHLRLGGSGMTSERMLATWGTLEVHDIHDVHEGKV